MGAVRDREGTDDSIQAGVIRMARSGRVVQEALPRGSPGRVLRHGVYKRVMGQEGHKCWELFWGEH